MAETERQMVERHVREGERHVANQRELLAHFREHGQPTDLAERLLRNLEDLLEMHRRHLEHLNDEQAEGPG